MAPTEPERKLCDQACSHITDIFNLRDLFGDAYKVCYEPAYYAAYGENARTDDPAYLILLCAHGHVYPAGSGRLGASTNKHGPIAAQLAKLHCTQIEQDGDDGLNVSFDLSDLKLPLEIMQPLHKQVLSKSHRQ